MRNINLHMPYFTAFRNNLFLNVLSSQVNVEAIIMGIIIYQSSKFSFSCVSLVESVSREIDEIRLSRSHKRAREIMQYSPVNNKKKSRAPSREHATYVQPKTANVL